MKKILIAALIAGLATPGLAEIQIRNAYARSAMPGASSGAAYMTIVNTGPGADRLIGVASEAARKVELHSMEMVDGVAQMRPIGNGLDLPPGTLVELSRGGNHVMMMGLATPLVQDDVLRLTLIFEVAGEMVLDIPVDYLALDPLGSNGAPVNAPESVDAPAEGETPDDGDETPDGIIEDAEAPITD